jgi:hypothetical protein
MLVLAIGGGGVARRFMLVLSNLQINFDIFYCI